MTWVTPPTSTSSTTSGSAASALGAPPVRTRARVAAGLLVAFLVALVVNTWSARRSAIQRAAIQRAAILTLFTQREHAQQLLLWSDASHESPTLQLLRGRRGAAIRFTSSTTALAALDLPLPVEAVTLADLEAHFGAHADAWEAWFARFPASSGIIALTEPVLAPAGSDGASRAVLIVARTCGEHCHSAWRVAMQRDARGGWRTTSVQPLALPLD